MLIKHLKWMFIQPKLLPPKTTLKLFSPQDRKIQYNPFQALQLIRLHSFTTFTQTIDVCIKLGVNPKNGQQIVRGVATMPSGLGIDVKVAVLCQEQLEDEATASGANIFLDDDKIKKIQNGEINFDKLFCTLDMLPRLKHLAKILGPKGLMPNTKVGTLVEKTQLSKAIKLTKEGQVTFRVDSGKNIHAPIGKITFTDQQLLRNFKSLMKTLDDKRPESFKKGKYFVEAFMKSTMGPRWRIKMDLINPSKQSNIWDLIQ